MNLQAELGKAHDALLAAEELWDAAVYGIATPDQLEFQFRFSEPSGTDIEAPTPSR